MHAIQIKEKDESLSFHMSLLGEYIVFSSRSYYRNTKKSQHGCKTICKILYRTAVMLPEHFWPIGVWTRELWGHPVVSGNGKLDPACCRVGSVWIRVITAYPRDSWLLAGEFGGQVNIFSCWRGLLSFSRGCVFNARLFRCAKVVKYETRGPQGRFMHALKKDMQRVT